MNETQTEVYPEVEKTSKKADKNQKNTDIRGQYVILSGGMFWRHKNIDLSAVAEDDTPPRLFAKIPKDFNDEDIKIITGSVNNGELTLKDSEPKLNDFKIEVRQLNDDTLVEEMQEVDYLLHLSPQSMEKEIKLAVNNRQNVRPLLEKLFQEETRGRNREGYIKLIDKFRK